MINKTIAQEKNDLRRQFRSARRALKSAERKKSSLAIATQLRHSHEYQQAEHIGVYSAKTDELSLDTLIQFAREDQKSLYLPVIDHSNTENRMIFSVWQSGDKLIKNKYGIFQPNVTFQTIHAPRLDMVLLPLLAFDHQGQRLGMGGGYYDRFFSNSETNTTHHNAKNNHEKTSEEYSDESRGASMPARIGIAHSSQQCDFLPGEEWDILLHAVITENEILRFK